VRPVTANNRLTPDLYPAGMIGNVRFNWVKTRTAWQDMESRRAKRAQFIKADIERMEATNATFSNAMQNRISQSANITAEATLKRVQAAAKAKLEENSKQIEDAMKLIDTTQQSLAAPTSTTVNTII
jgi:hypothetical protein